MEQIKLITENRFQAEGLKQYFLYHAISDVYVETIDEFNGFDVFEGKIITSLNPDFFKPNLDILYLPSRDVFSWEDYIGAVNDIKSELKSKIISYDYKVYAVSSTSSGGGRKTFVNALLKYFSLNYNSAKLDFMSRKGFNGSSDLASVMLVGSKCIYRKPDILKLGERQLVIPGFMNIDDFIGMSFDDFMSILDIYCTSYQVEKFVIDVYNPLLPISKKIIAMSERNIIIRKKDSEDKQLFEYISGLNPVKTTSFVNKVRGRLNDNELPLMRIDNDGFDKCDYKLFLSKLAKVL